VQAVKPAPSSEHSNVASERLEVNSNVAVVDVDGSEGLLVIVVWSSSARLLLHAYSAGVWSTCPPLEAVTRKVWSPEARPE